MKNLKQNLILHTYFPTIIGIIINPDHQIIEEQLTTKCLNLRQKIERGGKDWLGNETYNTFGTYHLCEDPDFSKINEFVTNQVIHYCKAQSIDLKCLNIHPVEAWFNVYKKDSFQEWHTHSHSMISAAYYLRCNDSSAKLYFKHPIMDTMSPNILSYNHLNFERIEFQPKPGMLIIFRSYLPHCVAHQKNNDTRICLSYNFRRKYA